MKTHTGKMLILISFIIAILYEVTVKVLVYNLTGEFKPTSISSLILLLLLMFFTLRKCGIARFISMALFCISAYMLSNLNIEASLKYLGVGVSITCFILLLLPQVRDYTES